MRSVLFHVCTQPVRLGPPTGGWGKNQATRLAVLGVVLLYVCCSMCHIESENS